jgi:hypothetical protein
VSLCLGSACLLLSLSQCVLGSLRFNVVYLDLAVVDDRPFVADLRQKIVHALLVLALTGVVRLHDVDEVLWRAVARLPKNVYSPFHIRHRQCKGHRDRTRAIDIESLQNRFFKVCYVLLLVPAFQG